MKVVCDTCKTKLNVPDDKIRAGKTLTFKCPKCRNTVVANASPPAGLPSFDGLPDATPPPSRDLLGETQTVVIPPPLSRSEISTMESLGEALEDEMEALTEGSLRALVAAPGYLELISPTLRKLGHIITAVRTSKDALSKLQYNFYNMVILDEKFDESESQLNLVHQYLEALSMDVRRKMFFVFIGNNFKTLDNMTAFVKSANLVINGSDFTNFELILKKSINENDVFYAAFNKMLKETGKELDL